MRSTFVICLLAIFATTLLAAPNGRGGKGRGCKNKPSPCADGSTPLCRDGSQPDKNVRPPSCSDGGIPVCNDGAEPRSPHAGNDNDRDRNPSGRRGRNNGGDEDNDRSRNPSGRRGRDSRSDEDNDDSDDDCDGKKAGAFGRDRKLSIIIGACVGGTSLIISLCCCAYCWRRAARLANTKEQAPPTEIVVGKTVQGCVDFQPKQEMQTTVVVGHIPQNLEHEPSNCSGVAASANAASDCNMTSTSGEAV